MTDLARYCQQRYYAWLDSQGIKIVDGFAVDDECKQWVGETGILSAKKHINNGKT